MQTGSVWDLGAQEGPLGQAGWAPGLPAALDLSVRTKVSPGSSLARGSLGQAGPGSWEIPGGQPRQQEPEGPKRGAMPVSSPAKWSQQEGRVNQCKARGGTRQARCLAPRRRAANVSCYYYHFVELMRQN